MSKRQIIVSMLAVFAAVGLCRAAEPVTFAKLRTDMKVTTMALTEDGSHLVTAHEADNTLCVWSLAAGKLVKKLKCPSPRHMLGRGGQLYVANYGKGTISIYSIAEDWKLARTVKVGDPNVYYLSAPQGKYFKGMLIAMCGKEMEPRKPILLDVNKGKGRPMPADRRIPLATFSYSGHMILQHDLNTQYTHLYKYGRVIAIDTRRYLPKMTGLNYKFRGSSRLLSALRQVDDSGIWFSTTNVYGGRAARRMIRKPGAAIFTDARNHVVYVLGKDSLRACRPDSALTQLGDVRKAVLPDWLKKKYSGPAIDPWGRTMTDLRDFTYCGDKSLIIGSPLAATTNGKVYLFLLYPWKDRPLWRAKTEAFGKKATAPAPVAGDGPVTFHTLPVRDAVSSIALSSDGRQLLTAMESMDQVAIWDVVTGAHVKTIACESPRHILVRGDRAYIANYAQGTISVFSQSSGWVLQDKLETGFNLVWYLSAPQGEHFQGQILASCVKFAAGQNRGFVLVDVKKDSHRVVKLVSGRFATFSYDGRHIIEQEFWSSPSAKVTMFDTSAYLAGSRQAGQEGEHADHPYLYQVHPGGLWAGTNGLYGGTPPKGVVKKAGLLVFADVARKALYVLDKDALRACRLDMKMTETGRRPAVLPAWTAETVGPRGRRDKRSDRPVWPSWSSASDLPKTCMVSRPIAITLGDKLYLFFQDPQGRTVHRAVTAAFGAAVAGTVAVAEPKGPSGFQPVPTKGVVSSMALSQDGRHLLTGDEDLNKLVVWDVATGREIKTIKCPAPRYIMVRGDRAYVANYGKGTISVYSQEKGWKLADEVSAGAPGVYYLSAPQGRYFKGQILATCGSDKKRTVQLVDVRTDSAKKLFEFGQRSTPVAVATIDYTGTSVLEQENFAAGFGGKLEAFAAKAYLEGRRQSLGRGDHTSTPLLGQFHRLPVWTGGARVFTGIPPMPVGGRRAPRQITVPDLIHRTYYVLTKKGIAAHHANAAQTRIGTRPLPVGNFPPVDGYRNRVTVRENSDHTWTCTPPLAATIDGKLHIYFFDGKTSRLLRYAGAAFDVKGAAVAAGSGLPSTAVEGRKLTCKLPGAKAGTTFTLVKGPKGMTVSPGGVVTWTPSAAEVGGNTVKIKVAAGDDLSFLRYSVNVVSKALAAKVGVTGNMKSPGRHYLLYGSCHLTYSHDYRSILLLNGIELRILDADGMVVQRRTLLDERYRAIIDRPDYFIALGDTFADILDRRTFKRRKRIELNCHETVDLVAHPGARVCYAAVRMGQTGGAKTIQTRRIIEIDEAKGTAQLVAGVYGERLAVDPRGRYLYVSLHDTYRKGYLVDWRLGDIYVAYGVIDVLMSYNIQGHRLEPVAVQAKPGRRGTAIRVSPDGRCVSYISPNGFWQGPGGSDKIVGSFDADKIDKVVSRYAVGSRPVDLSYHPVFDLVAGCNRKTVTIFQRRTGKTLTSRLDTRQTRMEDIRRVMFTPAGRRLLVAYKDEKQRRVLQAFDLILSAAERTELAAGPRPPKVAGMIASATTRPRPTTQPGPVTVVPAAKLHALKPPLGRKEVTVKEIGRRYMDSVVQVKSGAGSGTGFFVGGDGYILTCAHVLARLGNPMVSYRRRAGDQVRTVQAVATVVRKNVKEDLALLKITIKVRPRSVALGKAAGVEAGERVVIIGHPGLGNTTLNYTMTSGIVSNPRQKLGGSVFLQTTATVNPGSSGGPVFNSRGHLIGLVILKGRIEAAGFAVPADRLRTFLTACTRKP